MFDKNDLIPVSLFTGYLGAGKTTLLNYVLNNQEGYNVAVIVNDIGEVNIDASLIQKGGAITQEDGDLVALSNGCICCTLKVDLMNQIIELAASKRFDYILIEASGICEPGPIADSICMLDGSQQANGFPALVYLDNISTVVDAKRMVDEFSSGSALLSDDLDEEDIENLLIQQIEFCSTIILNKIDEVTQKEKKDILEIIRALQPKAKIIETTFGRVDLSDILCTHSFDIIKTYESAGWAQAMEQTGENSQTLKEEHHDEHDDHEEHDEHKHHHDHKEHDDHEHHHDHEEHEHHHDDHEEHGHHHHHHHHHDEGEAEEYGISTFVYENVLPFDKTSLENFLFSQWPRSIIRTKGYFWIAQAPSVAYIFEQSGKQKTVNDDGDWIVAFPEPERSEILKANPELIKNWDKTYGDRINKLVFIGKGMDKKAIIKALDDCLFKGNIIE